MAAHASDRGLENARAPTSSAGRRVIAPHALPREAPAVRRRKEFQHPRQSSAYATRAAIGRPLTCRCAHRDVERQLGQAAAAAAAAVAGRAAAGRRLPAGDEARRRQARRAPRLRARGSRLRDRGARRGRLERRGDPLARRAGRRGRGTAGRPGLPASGGARGGRDVRGRPGGLGLRPERPHAGLGSLSLQARVAGVAARRGRGRAGGDGRLRRREHRADRRGRLRSRRLRRPDARHAARAGGAGGAPGGRAARRRARPLARRAGVHLLGLPGGDVPPGLRDAHRPRARQRAGRRSRPRRLDRPAGPQGQGAERSRAGDRRPGRGAGR